MEDFAGKVAVITGAASGIGRALAERFADEGMRLVLADIEQPALDALADIQRARGVDVLPVVTDVARAESVAELAERAAARFGGVDVLCNNAGVGVGGMAWEIPPAVWEWILGVNLWGVIHGINAFVPEMVKRDSGYVVNTASIAGLTVPPTMGAYGASKHAVVSISETLYHELALIQSHVRVSLLCPGIINTAIADSQRNWPEERLGSFPTVGRDRVSRLLQERHHRRLARGTSPATIANMVLAAMKEERFWIVDDTDRFGDPIRRRFTDATAQRNPSLMPVAFDDSAT